MVVLGVFFFFGLFFNTLLSLVGSSGHLIYLGMVQQPQEQRYLFPISLWSVLLLECPCLGVLTCAYVLMIVTANGAYTNTVRESAGAIIFQLFMLMGPEWFYTGQGSMSTLVDVCSLAGVKSATTQTYDPKCNVNILTILHGYLFYCCCCCCCCCLLLLFLLLLLLLLFLVIIIII